MPVTSGLNNKELKEAKVYEAPAPSPRLNNKELKVTFVSAPKIKPSLNNKELKEFGETFYN